MNKLKIIIVIIVLFLLTGCNDYRELSNMSIVSSIGIDKVNDEYKITTQILDSKMKNGSSENGGTTPEIVVYHSTGKTLHESLRNAVLDAPKKLYVGHVETVLISENIVKNDVSDIFDFILRDAEMSKDFNILLVRNASIEEIMDILTPLETIPAENISSSIELSSNLEGSVDNVSFDKFVSNILQPGVDAVIPIITIDEVKSSNEEIDPKKRLVISKEMGIFDDDHFLTYINKETSIGYNIINGNTTGSVISFKCDNNTYSSMELINNKSDLSFDIKTNTINLNINLKGALSELNCNIDITKESNINELENKMKEELKSIMNKMIDTAIKYNKSDFLAIGEYIFQNNNKFYKDNTKKIPTMISNMNRKIKINIEFIQKGTIKEGDEKY